MSQVEESQTKKSSPSSNGLLAPFYFFLHLLHVVVGLGLAVLGRLGLGLCVAVDTDGQLLHDAIDVLEVAEVDAMVVHLVHDVFPVRELEDVVVELHIGHHELGVLVDAADELLPVLGELVVLVDAVRELLLVLIELAVRVVVVHELLRVLLLLHDALDVLEAVEVEVDTLAALAVHLVHDVLLVPELEDVVVELHIRHHELGVLVDAADELLPVLGELVVLVDAVRELLLVFVKCLLNLLFGWLLSMNSCGRFFFCMMHSMFSKR